MENLATKFRFVAIEFPIKRANIAVPIPTVPPRAAPMINTLTSIAIRTRAIRIPVLR